MVPWPVCIIRAPDSELLFIEMGTLKFYDWLIAHSRRICGSVSGVDYVSVLPGDLNSPEVLV